MVSSGAWEWNIERVPQKARKSQLASSRRNAFISTRRAWCTRRAASTAAAIAATAKNFNLLVTVCFVYCSTIIGRTLYFLDIAVELGVWGSRPLLATATIDAIELAPRDRQSSCSTRVSRTLDTTMIFKILIPCNALPGTAL